MTVKLNADLAAALANGNAEALGDAAYDLSRRLPNGDRRVNAAMAVAWFAYHTKRIPSSQAEKEGERHIAAFAQELVA